MSAKKQYDLCAYLNTVMKMMKERHPDCRFTILATYPSNELDEDGAPTVNAALTSHETDLDLLSHQIEQIQQRIDAERPTTDSDD